MDTLIIEKKDDVYLTVDCDPNIQREISEFFTFYVPGYKFMPAFRTRMWDGKIRLYSQKLKELNSNLKSKLQDGQSLYSVLGSSAQ